VYGVTAFWKQSPRNLRPLLAALGHFAMSAFDPYLPLMGVRFAALGPAACIGRLSLTDERG
jgi:hypothetical protein